MDVGRADERVRVPGARCPYCHEEVPRGEEPAVCVACHALHHVGCFQEHGACSACGAAHPRFATREVAIPRAADVGPWEAPRQPNTLLSLAIFALTGVGAFVSLAARPGANDAGVAAALLAAAFGGLLGTSIRGARFGWGAACVTLSPALWMWYETSSHARLVHGDATVTSAVAALVVGIVLLVIELLDAVRLRSRRRAAKEDGAGGKGGGAG